MSRNLIHSDEKIVFDATRVKTVRPTLGKVKGYNLEEDELKAIFGIDAKRFGELPSRMVVPVLEGQQIHNGTSITGNLYLVEPVAWIPHVWYSKTIPAGVFKTQHNTTVKTVAEATFTCGTSASLNIQGTANYNNISATAKFSCEMSLSIMKSCSTTETSTTTGTTGDVPIHELMIYPVLQCKVIKLQKLNYSSVISSSGSLTPEITWGRHSGDDIDNDFWERRRVASTRLGEGILKLSYHPIPMTGHVDSSMYLLPVPQMTSTGEVEVTTLLSRSNWKDWFHYDAPWENPTHSDQIINIAVPNNGVAFRPMATWTDLVGAKDKLQK
ncbi:hypothetical protein MD484_g817, partial [Candolleomyces efflorescens]